MNWMAALAISLLLPFSAAQAAMYKYNEMQVKDYDEMLAMVRAKVNKARDITGADTEDENASADREAVELLREALKIIFSRPNVDNMVAKLIPDVRKELTGLSAYEDTVVSLVGEALSALDNSKLPKEYRATALFVLENIMAEIKPEAPDREEFRRALIRIRDAKVKIPEDVQRELKLRGMFKKQNPSEQAKLIVEKLPAPKAKDKEPTAEEK